MFHSAYMIYAHLHTTTTTITNIQPYSSVQHFRNALNSWLAVWHQTLFASMLARRVKPMKTLRKSSKYLSRKRWSGIGWFAIWLDSVWVRTFMGGSSTACRLTIDTGLLIEGSVIIFVGRKDAVDILSGNLQKSNFDCKKKPIMRLHIIIIKS